MAPFATRSVALAIAAMICVPAAALGAERPRISIAGVRGDPDGSVAAQLGAGLCTQNECVPGERVRRGGKIDFAAARAEGVAGIVFSTVSKGAKRRVAVALLTGSLTPRRIWTVPFDAQGRVSRAALAGVQADIARELAGERRGAAEPAAAATPRPTREPQLAPASRTSPGTSPGRTPSRPVPATPAADGTLSASRHAAVDLGVDVSNRKLSFSGVGAGGTLLGFSANAIASPAIRAEVSPLAGGEDRWYAGTTVFAAYSRSLGLQTEDATAANARHATTLSRLEVGAGLRFPVSRASLLARVSYRTLSVKVSPRGAIPGLPDADLAGPSVGADVEVPLGRRWALLAGASYTYWMRAKDLVKGGYFGSGSAWGLDVEGGAAVLVRGPFSVRALLEYGQTRYSLSGGTTYVATGATDRYIGGRVLGRVVF